MAETFRNETYMYKECFKTNLDLLGLLGVDVLAVVHHVITTFRFLVTADRLYFQLSSWSLVIG